MKILTADLRNNYNILNGAKHFSSNIAKKVSIFRVLLVRIFWHLEWIGRDTPYLSEFGLNAGKYVPEKQRIWALFRQGNALQNYLASQLYSSYFKSENSKIGTWKSKECLKKVLHVVLLIQS